MDRGWGKVPTNKSDTKMKIIRSLISMRKEGEDGKYILD